MDIKKILSIPRSLYFNIRVFGMGGVKLPIVFSNKTRIKGLRKGCFICLKPDRRVFIGFDGVKGLESNSRTNIVVGPTGKIIFEGSAFVAAGSTIRVDEGTCTFGDAFSCNTNCFISCTRSVTFGKGCLLGWNVNVRDSDGHTIITADGRKDSLKEVVVGDNVWIAANVDILKGVHIGNGNVIGYRSCVTKAVEDEHCLIGGYPAKVLTRNISWER